MPTLEDKLELGMRRELKRVSIEPSTLHSLKLAHMASYAMSLNSHY
jgi:hypothetical protein